MERLIKMTSQILPNFTWPLDLKGTNLNLNMQSNSFQFSVHQQGLSAYKSSLGTAFKCIKTKKNKKNMKIWKFENLCKLKLKLIFCQIYLFDNQHYFTKKKSKCFPLFFIIGKNMLKLWFILRCHNLHVSHDLTWRTLSIKKQHHLLSQNIIHTFPYLISMHILC